MSNLMPDFAPLDNLLHDDDEYVSPTAVHVFYSGQVDGDMKDIHVPGAAISLRLRSVEYQPRLRSVVQSYVDGLSNSATAMFIFRNQTTSSVAESKVKQARIEIKVPKHIATAVSETLTQYTV